MRERFLELVQEAINSCGGEATIVETCRYIWDHHEAELRKSGDHFYTWQYEVRWAANRLKRQDILEYGRRGRNNLWILRGGNL